jgi:DNA-binding transcriptional LysR family regulator
MDRLTALNIFRHVVELGSFAEASRRLNLSPAAISKNVNELESYLGVRLMNRTTRTMSLTESGSFYYGRISHILDDLVDADDVITDLRQVPKGTLRVSAPVSVTLTSLSNQIPTFLDRYPELSLDLHLDDRRVNLIEEGFDMALRGTDKLEDSSLVARKLKVMKHAVCCAPSYLEKYGTPKSPEDLAKHNCIQFLLSDHATEWTFKKDGLSVAIPIDGRYKVGSSLAVRDALRNGFGLSLIPLMYVKEDLKAGHLQTVLDDWTLNESILYAVYPSRRYVVSKVRAFIDFLIDEFDEGN